MAPYQMYINGKFVNAKSGKTFNVYDPATEGVIATCPAGEAADVDAAVAAARAPSTAAGRTPRPRSAAASSSSSPTGSATADELAEHRDPQHRQADRRVGVRHHRRRHLLRVLRRPRHQDPRRRPARARQRDLDGAARADRRRGPDHPLELPAADGRLEAGAGDLRRLHDGDQAGRADAADPPRVRRASSRSAALPPGRRQRRHRLRRDRRRADRRPRGRGQDRLHRQRRGRQDHHARTRPTP